MPTEIIKELEASNPEHLFELLTRWWLEEEIQEEGLQGRVGLIYEKEDSNKFENYRPIPLPNILYKHAYQYKLQNI